MALFLYFLYYFSSSCHSMTYLYTRLYTCLYSSLYSNIIFMSVDFLFLFIAVTPSSITIAGTYLSLELFYEWMNQAR